MLDPDTDTDTDRDRVRHLLEDYEDHQRSRSDHLSERSLRALEMMRRRLERYPALCDLPIIQAPRRKVLQQLADALAADYAPSTTRRTWHHLREAWNWAQTYYPEVVPEALPPVELPERSGEVGYTPTLEELQATRGHMLLDWHRHFYTCLMATGARVHEIAELVWERIDWEAETVLLLGKGKRGGVKRPRLLPMSPTLREALRAQWVARTQPAHGAVWEANDPSQGIWWAIRRSCARAGLRDHTPHGIRRWIACELLERVWERGNGWGVKEYEAWMGHSLEMGQRIYASARPGRLEGAAEAVEALLAPNVIRLERKQG